MDCLDGNGGVVRRSMASCMIMLSAALMSSDANAVDEKRDPSTYALQYLFGTASDLVAEPRWQNIPGDALAKLEHIATNLGAKEQLANIGEEWSPDDHFRVDLPRAQHLFSAYSDGVAASVFVLGGAELKVFAVLARRHAQEYCIFRLPTLGLYSLRVSIVQHELRPDRDQTISAIPKCQLQSIGQPLQLDTQVSASIHPSTAATGER